MTEQKQSLTDLLNDRDELMAHLVEALDSGDEQQREIAREVLDDIILPALENKVDAIAHVLNITLPSRIDELKVFEAQVTAKRRALEQSLTAIKERLKFLHSTGRIDDCIKGSISEISIGNGSLSVNDTKSAPDQWGDEWGEYLTISTVYKIDKKKILADHKAGKPLPPGIEVRNGFRVSVKIRG